MSPFDEAFLWVVIAEGGFVNNPRDPGGPTNRGVSLRAVKLRDKDKDGRLDFDLDGDGDVDEWDIRMVTEEDAKRLYHEDYWTLGGAGRIHLLDCYSLPRRWGIAVFDAAVLQGPRTAVALMQKAVGVKKDGILGPITLEQVRRTREAEGLARFAAGRLERMRHHSEVDEFFSGWAWRITRLHQRLYGNL
jgi:lysozyme family protein